jgi:S1-C subfamily serine protease
MRFGFGLVSLLVVLAIVMVIFKNIEAPQIEVGHQAQLQAQQLSGRDANGMKAMESYAAQSFPPNGNFRGVQITDVTVGGPMDQYYGLKVGDVVLAIGGNDVTAFGGFDMAKAELDQAYQEVRELTVDRNGSKIQLPVGGAKSPLDSLNIPTH